MAKTNQLVVCGLPKCANVYIALSAAETLGCEPFVFCTRGWNFERVIPEALWQFAGLPNAIGGTHMPAERLHLNMLHEVGITRIAILVRDPRDACVSWLHHLNRPGVRSVPWHDGAHIAAGMISKNYREMTLPEQFADIFARSYPAFEDWLRGWARAIDTDSRFEFHVMRYEDFIADQRRELRRLFGFFGHHLEPVLPAIGSDRDAGVDPVTHFRRGIVGTFRDEVPPDVQKTVVLDPELAHRWQW